LTIPFSFRRVTPAGVRRAGLEACATLVFRWGSPGHRRRQLQLLCIQRDGDHSAARHFDLAVAAHHVYKLVELFGIAGCFECEAFERAIDSAGAENLGFLQDRRAVFFRCSHADQNQLAADCRAFGQVLGLQDVDQLVHLLDQLTALGGLDIYHDAHARELWVECAGDR
jgi:hypothetical protein